VAGLTASELARIRGRLEAFADDIFASLPRADQRARGQCYLHGLMLEGRRKSIEPMAARLGEVHYQALHHFVAASPWDWRPVAAGWPRCCARRFRRRRGWWTTPAFPRTAPIRWGYSASTAAPWASAPTASWPAFRS
jgi:DDE superfamily endonuclease